MRLSASVSFLLFLCSCGTDNNASLIESDFGGLVDLICDGAEFDQEQYDQFFFRLPDENRIPIEERLAQAKADCELMKPIRDNSVSLYENLSDGIWFPTRVYLFEFTYDRGDISQQRTAGYFETQENCNNSKIEFQEAGFNPRDCYSRLLFWRVAWT